MKRHDYRTLALSFCGSLLASVLVVLARAAFHMGAVPDSRAFDHWMTPRDAPSFTPGDFEGAVFVMQIIVASVVLLVLRSPRLSEFYMPAERRYPPQGPSREAFVQFMKGWQYIWATWLVLYLGLASAWAVKKYGPEDVWQSDYFGFGVWGFGDVMNMLTALGFFWCFLVLDKRSVNEDENDNHTAGFRSSLAQTLGIGFALIVLSLVDLHGRLAVFDYVGQYLMYTFNTLAMLFLFGRLDSHRLKMPRLVLMPLYCYALIQFPYSTFEILDKDPVFYRPVFFLLTLCLKAYLFLVITNMIGTGRIARYFKLVREENVPSTAS